MPWVSQHKHAHVLLAFHWSRWLPIIAESNKTSVIMGRLKGVARPGNEGESVNDAAFHFLDVALQAIYTMNCASWSSDPP